MTCCFREPMNGFTHCVGALLSAFGTLLLLAKVIDPLQPWHVTTFLVFGIAMILLYTTSTLYHWLRLSDSGQLLWRRIDHCMIFVYIAATYTPICLVPLRGRWGWTLCIAVWSVAVAGLWVKCFWLHAPRWISTALYLAMGWMVLFGVKPLVTYLPLGALLWLVAGGLLYSVGAVIYACKQPNFHRWLGFHELFHLLVMAGSFCHFMTMYVYIAVL